MKNSPMKMKTAPQPNVLWLIL